MTFPIYDTLQLPDLKSASALATDSSGNVIAGSGGGGGAASMVPEATSFTASSGNTYECSAALTATLPAPSTANQTVTIINTNGGYIVTITTPSGTIKGPGIPASTTSVTLGAKGLLQVTSDGTNYEVTGGQVDTGWVTLGLASGLTAFTATGYRLQGNTVRLRGTVTGTFSVGARSVLTAVLPALVRPVQEHYGPVSAQGSSVATNSTAAVDILTTGAVSVDFPVVAAAFTLDGVTYCVD